MARRLSDSEMTKETRVSDAAIGREICRVCGGAIVPDPANGRSRRLPHRRVCRKCGAEYGTTKPPAAA